MPNSFSFVSILPQNSEISLSSICESWKKRAALFAFLKSYKVFVAHPAALAIILYVSRILLPKYTHIETVCLLVRRNSLHINIDVNVEEMLQEKRGQATYPQIKEYVLEHTGLKVSSLYISQIKRKCGLDVGDNYNKPKSEDAKQLQCPLEKENAIKAALRHFGMI